MSAPAVPDLAVWLLEPPPPWLSDYPRSERFGGMALPDAEHRYGIPWYDAELPPEDHQCRAQTRGWIRILTYVERCACGAMSRGDGIWTNVNERRT